MFLYYDYDNSFDFVVVLRRFWRILGVRGFYFDNCWFRLDYVKFCLVFKMVLFLVMRK